MNALRRAAARLAATAARFAAEARGVAAIEFAMVLPVMVLMYLGMTEMTFGVNTNRKLTSLSRTLADLTGRAPTASSAEMDAIFGAATAVMAPYGSSNAKMVVSSIVVKKEGGVLKGRICWSTARGPGATAIPKNTVVTVPEGFGTENSSFIRADVDMIYTPVLGAGVLQAVTGSSTLALTEQTPWPVRNVKEVVWSGTTPCLT